MEVIFETEKGIEGRIWSYASDLYVSKFDDRLSEFCEALPSQLETSFMGLAGDIQRHSLEVGYRLAMLEVSDSL